MRNPLGRRKPALRHLTYVLALTTLAGGMIPATATAADRGTVRSTTQTQFAAATWSLVATIDPAHTYAPKAELVFYGAYAFTPDLVNFDPRRISGSVPQQVAPFIVVPRDGNSHTYKAVFHLTTDVTTSRTTSYQFRSQPPVTVPDGDADLEFTETVNDPSWHGFTLRNATADHWLFYACDIYEQTS